MATTRLPAFATPTSLDLRGLQQIINNIREGLQALDARITQVAAQAGQTTFNRNNDGQVLAALQNQLATLRAQVNTLLGAPAEPSSAPPLSLVMIAGDDGEPGDDGVPGAAVSPDALPGAPTFVAFPAALALGGHRAVRLLAGEAIYADNAVVADANVVLGITQGAVGAGALTRIQTGGLMVEPSWAWTVDEPVFVGGSGVLVQPSPASGFSLIVGVATSPTQILIGARTPLVLI